jgi:peptide/nickel transport system substrate-binding protein/oligopeptide transport system substrate-binding protein
MMKNTVGSRRTLAGLLCLAFFMSACKTVPAPEPPVREPELPGETGPLIPAPAPGPGPDFAETRPRVVIRDELTAVFSRGEVELDFRKSYLASEAQLFTGLNEGLFS